MALLSLHFSFFYKCHSQCLRNQHNHHLHKHTHDQRRGSNSLSQLTGSPTVTTPWSLTMLGCLNWPLMAASCRNLSLSSSLDSGLRVLIATSTGEPPPASHFPRFTTPNCPDPNDSPTLWGSGFKFSQRTLSDGLSLYSLNVLSGDLSVLVLRQLLVEIADRGGWGPVDVGFFKILTVTLCLWID